MDLLSAAGTSSGGNQPVTGRQPGRGLGPGRLWPAGLPGARADRAHQRAHRLSQYLCHGVGSAASLADLWYGAELAGEEEGAVCAAFGDQPGIHRLVPGKFFPGRHRGLFIGGIVVLLAHELLQKGWDLKRTIGSLFVCCFMLTGILFKTASFYDNRSYDGERKLLWTAAYAMWSDHKVSGVGITTWNAVYRQKYISPKAREPHLDLPHNNIANFFSATGTLGGIGYLVFTGYTFYFLLKKRQEEPENGLLLVMLWIHTAFFIHGMVDNTMFGKYGLRLYFALWGMTLASLYDDKKLSKS